MGFVVDKVALWQVFSEFFGFPCRFSFHQLLHIHHHHLSSGAGTIGQFMADVPSGLSLNNQKWPPYKGLSPTYHLPPIRDSLDLSSWKYLAQNTYLIDFIFLPFSERATRCWCLLQIQNLPLTELISNSNTVLHCRGSYMLLMTKLMESR
jgi:hypothetical protein